MIRIFTGCNQFELVIFVIFMCSIHCVSSSIHQTRVPVYKLKFEFRAKIFELNPFDTNTVLTQNLVHLTKSC